MLQLVGDEGRAESGGCGKDEDGDAEGLDAAAGVGWVEGLDNSRGEEVDAIGCSDGADVDEDVDPDLPVEESALASGPVEAVHLEGTGLGGDAVADHLALGIVEELHLLRPVHHQQPADKGHADGDASLEDEDPAPAGVAVAAGHTGNGVGEKTTKGTSKSVTDHEDVEAPLELEAGVVGGEEDDAA